MTIPNFKSNQDWEAYTLLFDKIWHCKKALLDRVKDDTIRAWVWRLTGLLFYWKSVRDARKGIGTPKTWNEIGL